MMATETINYQRIEQAISYLSEHFTEQPNLDDVATQVHLSPYHFQRMFTEWAGISPKKFLQYLTTDFLKNKIAETPNIIEAANLAGLSSQSRVYDLFVTLEAVTPQEFKSGGERLRIDYGYHDTPFGECFVAATERGICGLEFVNDDTKAQYLQAFQQKWRNAEILYNPDATIDFTRHLFSNSVQEQKRFHLLVNGTKFQVKVWEALLRVPFGAVTTYGQIAGSIGQPGASRAVGSAVGDNPIAYLIPCHRVIRKEGKLGEYHWGSTRKKAIVGWEMARNEG
ncbi:MAG: methylated-DNA--[protein]-cysteine S-methyltransferase [Saprospiraceae bacterium]|nr:methylated-DNA--[protein]-cysteine S-methyltransferase [Saprospiraceae bacterium]